MDCAGVGIGGVGDVSYFELNQYAYPAVYICVFDSCHFVRDASLVFEYT